MIILAQQFQIPGPSGSQTVVVPTVIPPELQGNLGTTGVKVFRTGLQLLFLGAVVLAVIFIIYSGIEWITSSGDPLRIQSAKKRLMYSIIGLVVVSLSFLIFNLLAAVLGKTSIQLLGG